MFPCVAIKSSLSDKPPIQNADRWPSPLMCDSHKLKHYNEVVSYITEPSSQWVRAFPPSSRPLSFHFFALFSNRCRRSPGPVRSFRSRERWS
jgi:hypothetical protein